MTGPAAGLISEAAGGRLDRHTGHAHVLALDGLRGLAVLLVMVVHLTVLESPALVDRIFMHAAFLGWIGVDLFFVLSGFLITGILYDARGAAHYFRNFYMRRSLRIFPLYYTVVFFALVLAPSLTYGATIVGPRPLTHEWSHWVYLSNFAVAAEQQFGTGMLIVAWSLAVEEQFYLLWAPVVRRLSGATLVRLCLVLVAAAILTRTAMVAADMPPVAMYVLPFARMDALALGAVVAILVRQGGGVRSLTGPAGAIAPCAAVLVVVVSLMDMDPTWRGTATQTVGYTIIAVMFACLLVLAIADDGRIPRLLTSAPLVTFGKYSYGVYLLHLPVRAFIRDHVYGPEHFPALLGSHLVGQLLFYGMASGAALLAAWCSWHLLEKHFLKLKRHFPMVPAE